MSIKTLTSLLTTEFEPTFLRFKDQSDGCGAKIYFVIVSKKFEGLGLLERHRAVNKCIESEMKNIHAIQMKTWTPDQYEKKKDKLVW